MAAKKGFSTILVAALVLVVLFLTNPKQADFKAYLASQAQAGSANSGPLIGALSKGAAAIASGTGSLYARKDYLLCSTYSLGNKGGLYLGFAKRVFLKLR